GVTPRNGVIKIVEVSEKVTQVDMLVDDGLERLPLDVALIDEHIDLRYLLADLDDLDDPVPGGDAGGPTCEPVPLDGHGQGRISYPGSFPLRQFLLGSGRIDAGSNGP